MYSIPSIQSPPFEIRYHKMDLEHCSINAHLFSFLHLHAAWDYDFYAYLLTVSLAGICLGAALVSSRERALHKELDTNGIASPNPALTVFLKQLMPLEAGCDTHKKPSGFSLGFWEERL